MSRPECGERSRNRHHRTPPLGKAVADYARAKSKPRKFVEVLRSKAASVRGTASTTKTRTRGKQNGLQLLAKSFASSLKPAPLPHHLILKRSALQPRALRVGRQVWRPRRQFPGIGLDLLHQHVDGFLQLRILSLNDQVGWIIDHNVGLNSAVLNHPLAVKAVGAKTRAA